jgi:uncharacterized protein involved in exopolysaccharide biosynthesis
MLHPLWAQRKLITVVSLGVGIITLVINFLLPLYYRSTATLLPETEKNKLGSLSQFAGIAQLAGVSLGSSADVARLYPTIVTSETVLRNVIEKQYHSDRFHEPVNLIRYFELDEGTPEKNMAKALEKLRNALTTTFDAKTSVVSISVVMREPHLAADVLNSIIDELDQFMRQKRITSASEQAKWIDDRIKDVQQELRTAEEALKNFRERNRRVADSPQLLLEQERLSREVQVKSTIFIELKKQYELARIEEIKNTTIVDVLDPGRAPVKKDGPKRATNSAIMFLVALVGTSGYVAVQALHGERIRQFLKSFRR